MQKEDGSIEVTKLDMSNFQEISIDQQQPNMSFIQESSSYSSLPYSSANHIKEKANLLPFIPGENDGSDSDGTRQVPESVLMSNNGNRDESEMPMQMQIIEEEAKELELSPSKTGRTTTIFTRTPLKDRAEMEMEIGAGLQEELVDIEDF